MDPAKRITAAEALEHPWVVSKDDADLAEHSLTASQKELRRYNARRKFRAGVHGVSRRRSSSDRMMIMTLPLPPPPPTTTTTTTTTTATTNPSLCRLPSDCRRSTHAEVDPFIK